MTRKGNDMKKSSKLNNLKSELILKFAEIDDLCKHYGYSVIPTLLLRHKLGADSSILISNDQPSEIISAIGGICTGELTNSGGCGSVIGTN